MGLQKISCIIEENVVRHSFYISQRNNLAIERRGNRKIIFFENGCFGKYAGIFKE